MIKAKHYFLVGTPVLRIGREASVEQILASSYLNYFDDMSEPKLAERYPEYHNFRVVTGKQVAPNQLSKPWDNKNYIRKMHQLIFKDGVERAQELQEAREQQ